MEKDEKIKKEPGFRPAITCSTQQDRLDLLAPEGGVHRVWKLIKISDKGCRFLNGIVLPKGHKIVMSAHQEFGNVLSACGQAIVAGYSDDKRCP